MDPSWAKEFQVMEFVSPKWQRSSNIVKQNMSSGRVLSADNENYMHFFVLQHLNLIVESADATLSEKYMDELIQLMSRYKELGGHLE